MKRCVRTNNCRCGGFDHKCFVWVGKGLTFFQNLPKMPLEKKHGGRTQTLRCGRHSSMDDDDDDDDDEICDQKRSRVARWALEEVRRRVRERGFFVAKHFKKLTPKTANLFFSVLPLFSFSFRAVLPVFLPSVRERGGRGTGKMPVAEKQR